MQAVQFYIRKHQPHLKAFYASYLLGQLRIWNFGFLV